MTPRVIAAMAAIVLAIAGTVLLVSYVRGIERQVADGERIIEILVVQEAVIAGTLADDLGSRVDVEPIAARHVVEGALADLASVEGLLVVTDLVPGEQLLASRFAPVEAIADDEIEVPAGLHQVTLQLESYRVLGAWVSPGDTVGVFISVKDSPTDELGDTTRLVLHKVLVTRIQLDGIDVATEQDFSAVAPSGRVLVTLAATAGEVEQVVFGAEHGSIWLSLEPLDASEHGTRLRDRATIFG